MKMGTPPFLLLFLSVFLFHPATAQIGNLATRHASGSNNSVDIDTSLVKIPGGAFRMGDPFGDGFNSEQPVQTITLSDFYLSRYELTFREFDAFCDATRRPKPDDAGMGRGDFPLINVSWYDAVEYCNWRSAQYGLRAVYTIDTTLADPANTHAGRAKNWTVAADWNAGGYRLPTEAEWEYAARAERENEGVVHGGGNVRFGDGSNILNPVHINVDASYFTNISMQGKSRGRTVPVHSLSANAFGLKNMSGNVWEWCWDWYDKDRYKKIAGNETQNPKGAPSGEGRVVRGGSWSYDVEDCQTTRRSLYSPSLFENSRGFRVARGL
jgi:formylglycine-generating enzyme required for sulfatase activity